jgi:hypothetical protein
MKGAEEIHTRRIIPSSIPGCINCFQMNMDGASVVIPIDDIKALTPQDGVFLCVRNKFGINQILDSWEVITDPWFDSWFAVCSILPHGGTPKYMRDEYIRVRHNSEDIRIMENLMTYYKDGEDYVDELLDGVKIVGANYYPDEKHQLQYRVLHERTNNLLDIPEEIVEFCY